MTQSTPETQTVTREPPQFVQDALRPFFGLVQNLPTLAGTGDLNPKIPGSFPLAAGLTPFQQQAAQGAASFLQGPQNASMLTQGFQGNQALLSGLNPGLNPALGTGQALFNPAANPLVQAANQNPALQNAQALTPQAQSAASFGLSGVLDPKFNPALGQSLAAGQGSGQALSSLAQGADVSPTGQQAEQTISRLQQGGLPGGQGSGFFQINQPSDPSQALGSLLQGPDSNAVDDLVSQVTGDLVEQFEENDLPSLRAEALQVGQLGSSRDALARGEAFEDLGEDILRTSSQIREGARQQGLNRQLEAAQTAQQASTAADRLRAQRAGLLQQGGQFEAGSLLDAARLGLQEGQAENQLALQAATQGLQGLQRGFGQGLQTQQQAAQNVFGQLGQGSGQSLQTIGQGFQLPAELISQGTDVGFEALTRGAALFPSTLQAPLSQFQALNQFGTQQQQVNQAALEQGVNRFVQNNTLLQRDLGTIGDLISLGAGQAGSSATSPVSGGTSPIQGLLGGASTGAGLGMRLGGGPVGGAIGAGIGGLIGLFG